MLRRTYSAEETFALGEKIGRAAKPGDVYALTGDLGTGKTVFARGIARGLGIEEPVSSPTFTIMQIYEGGRLPLYHLDVYRIGDISEMEEVGCEDCFFGEGVTVVEWADIIEEILPASRFDIRIEKNVAKGFDYRRIVVEEVRHP